MYTNSKESEDFERIFRFIQKEFKYWKYITSQDEIQFTRIGGVSNFVYRLEPLKKTEEPNIIICKIFGTNSNDFVNRNDENERILYLSKLKLYPDVYTYNDQMRLENYIPHKQMTYEFNLEESINLKIIQKLAKLHSIKMEDINPVSYIKNFIQFDNPIIEKALFKLKENYILTSDQLHKYEIICKYFDKIELTKLQQSFKKLNYKLIRFCHNDLFINNVLLMESDDVYLIDYEYSNYNYFSYDLANYFQQFVYEYTNEKPYYRVHLKNYPSNDVLRIYLEEYLKNGDNTTSEICDIEKLIEDLKICTLHCNFFWMIWSLLMNGNPCYGEFDFVDFAYSRYNLYLKAKELLIKYDEF